MKELLAVARKGAVTDDASGTLPLPLVVVAFALACAAAYGLYRTHFTLLALGLVPLLWCGFQRPQTLLILAIAFAPMTTSLSGGDPRRGQVTAFAVSDVAFLLALPGILAQAWRQRASPSLGRLTLPLTLYLVASLLSFALNIPAMQAKPLSYLLGFFRTVQVALLLPLAFALCRWQRDELRNLLCGYLLGGTALAVGAIVAFFAVEGGLWSFGMQKNAVGLALACAAIIALIALTQERDAMERNPADRTPTGFSRSFLLGILALNLFGLTCTLSRGSGITMLIAAAVIAALRRNPRIVAGVALGYLLSWILILPFLHSAYKRYMTDFSSSQLIVTTRIESYRKSLASFRAHPLLGDGFRSRRDYLPHNLEILLLAENGIIGTALFVWLLVVKLRLLWDAWRAWAPDPIHEWVCLAVLVCTIAVLVHAQFDPYWRRGPLWLSWGGAGLIVALLAERRQRRLSE